MHTEELIQMLENLKSLILENGNPDGTCNFDGDRVKTMLQLTAEIFEKSILDD